MKNKRTRVTKQRVQEGLSVMEFFKSREPKNLKGKKNLEDESLVAKLPPLSYVEDKVGNQGSVLFYEGKYWGTKLIPINETQYEAVPKIWTPDEWQKYQKGEKENDKSNGRAMDNGAPRKRARSSKISNRQNGKNGNAHNKSRKSEAILSH